MNVSVEERLEIEEFLALEARFADVGLSNPDYYCIEKAISK